MKVRTGDVWSGGVPASVSPVLSMDPKQRSPGSLLPAYGVIRHPISCITVLAKNISACHHPSGRNYYSYTDLSPSRNVQTSVAGEFTIGTEIVHEDDLGNRGYQVSGQWEAAGDSNI